MRHAALADVLSAASATYAYELHDPGFVWAPNLSPAPLPVGASHSSDLVYLFDGLGYLMNNPLDTAQAELAEQMVAAWSAFIRGGSPRRCGLCALASLRRCATAAAATPAGLHADHVGLSRAAALRLLANTARTSPRRGRRWLRRTPR